MKTLKQLSILTSLAAVSLLTGCDIAEDTCSTDADCAEGETCQIAEGSADANICVAAEGSGSGSGSGSGATCTTDPTICTADQQCDDGACIDFQYVTLVSRGTLTDGELNTPGPDIDAIAVVRGGVSEFASEFKQFVKGGETADGNVNSDASKLLGPNDAMTDSNSPKVDCDLDGTNSPSDSEPPTRANDAVPTFCSLGFTDGFVVVKMPTKLRDGDEIKVYELGSTWCENVGRTRADEYEIYVGGADLVIDASTTVADVKAKFTLLGGQTEANGGIATRTFQIN